MTYCIDIDDTLLNTEKGNYAASTPIKERIEKVQQLFDDNHTIILNTARNPVFYELTEKQMIEFNIPYHVLLLGKPYADYYIDDKAINDRDFFK